jgi:D-serine dehydratase
VESTLIRTVDERVVVDRSVKGFPLGQPPTPLVEIGRLGWRLSGPELTYPIALLRTSALTGNLATMRRYCREAGVELAPHAKTTMVPEFVADQLDAGAWAMTAAVPRQAVQLWDFGVPRVLLANEVTDPAALAVLARAVVEPGRELLLFVDSTQGVVAADQAVAAAGGRRPR